MFKYGLLLFFFIVSAFAPGYSIAPLQVKSAKKQVSQKKTATANKKVTPRKGVSVIAKKGSNVKTATAKNKHSSKKSIRKRTSHKKGSVKRKSRNRSKYIANKVDTVRQNTLQIISSNKEKARVSDSLHKALISHQGEGVNTAKVDEGYFATLFSDQKKAASFQTLDGTASVFKSISGWQDKKFYILTNEIPIGTIVKITTADFKTICAKVINALPDVSNSIQYRLSDAAAAILGVTNKTFQITVTY